LIAIDGSPCAGVALELAGAMRWPADSTLHLVSVIEPGEAVIAGAWVPTTAEGVSDQLNEAADDAAATLDRSAAGLAATGARIETHVLSGRAATCIVELAEELEAELIVLGSRGHGTIGSMVLGSVSAEVADHARCPVLVARRSSLRRVMLASDGSSFARTAEEVVTSWTAFADTQIEVVSVASLTMPWSSGTAVGYPESDVNLAETSAAVIDEFRAIAVNAANRLNDAERHASARTVQGDPAAELLRVAREEDTDLIVLGTHGRTGLRRLLAGSVARNVMLHAPCSVMVVRTEQPAS
jgi:nucleotide-binding universal stress UspA family protein